MDITRFGKTYRINKLPQYESIEYSARLCCPECEDNFGYRWMDEMASDKIEGYVEVNGELQIVKRCKHCGTLYRFHLSKHYNEDFSFDVDAWKHDVVLHIEVHNHSYLQV